MSKMVLVCEDDEALRDLACSALTEHGYSARGVATLADLNTALTEQRADLVLLDLSLPDGDGIAFARQLRQSSDIPVIMVTGRSDPVDRVMGLELGADDYISKPYVLRELVARVKAVLRRAQIAADNAPRRGELPRAYKFGPWELLTGTRRLRHTDQRTTELTSSEFALLVAFLKSPRETLSRDRLLELSRLHDDIYDRTVDVQILRLRRKIEKDASAPEYIVTQRGAGYILNCDVQALA